MTPQLRLLRAGEEKKLGEAIAVAFFDDPVMKMMEPNEEKRLSKGTRVMSKMLGYCARYGEVHTDDSLLGGSAWLTPGNTEMTTWRVLRSGMWTLPLLMGFSQMRRMNRMDGIIRKVHKRVAPGDHWYLQILGTHPSAQGTGLGTAAIEVGVTKAEAAGLPVYLETMTQKNVDYYEKRGFRVAEQVEIEPEITMWAMLRG